MQSNDQKSTTARPLLLTRRQVAETLGICEQSVFNLTKSGQLKTRRIGKSVRYRRSDVEEFANRDQ